MNYETMPSERLLEEAARAWELTELSFVRKMENIVYACRCNGKKVFLRLTSPLRRSRAEIEVELAWIEHLAKCGLPVPQVVSDLEGKKICTFTDDKQRFEAVVFAEVLGTHPSEEVVRKPSFLRTLGSLIARMHQECHHGQKREEWNEERGLRHALQAASTSSDKALAGKLLELVTWMKTLPKEKTNYGLVHADLGAMNLFVEGDDKISIIDFDDSCQHWFAFDLAIVIYSMAGRFEHATKQPEEAVWLGHLLEGYRTIRDLPEEEVNWIDRFMDFATLRLIFWIEHHQTLGTFHDEAVEKVAKFKAWAVGRISA